jgi:hypothetical protein
VSVLLPILVGLTGLAAGAWLWRASVSRVLKAVLVIGSTGAVFFLVATVVANIPPVEDGPSAQDLVDQGAVIIDAVALGMVAVIFEAARGIGAAIAGVLWGVGCGMLWLVALGLGATVARRARAKEAE